MLNRKHVIFSCAALAALPLTSKAAVITYQFDLSDILVSATATGTYVAPSAFPGASLTGTAANPVLTVPVGTYIEYGLDAEVTGAGTYGIAAFQTGITNSTLSATSTAVVAPGPTTVNPFFSSNAAVGNVDGLGGINDNLGTAGSYVAGGTTSTAKINYGEGTFANLYSSQRLKPLTTGNASFTLTATNLALAFNYLTKGTNGSSATYSNTAYNPATDTVNAMPVLHITYGATTGGGSTSAQPIIALLTTAPTSYASQLGSTIALTYTGPGGYVPGSTTFSASNKGYGVVTGFHTPDTEIYALDVLNASGGALTSAQISAVVSDINASESGVTASLVTGIYSKLFPGYDVLLTGTTPATTGTTYYLGIDFSATGDQDPATQGFTVGAIAAVPEPATMAGLVLGASGLLLGRRKNRAVAA
jgi:hypothetical protein